MTDLIKNKLILEEDYQTDDLLDFSTLVSDFRTTLDNITNNAVLGLVGQFGSGKSTMLYQLYKEQKDSVAKWVVFDAWKYPERKDLWESFVLDIAKQLDKKLFDSARKTIDGTSKNDIKSLISVLSKGANVFLPGLGIAENFNSLFKSSPARRVFEFQEILSEIIKKIDKDIFIIVEDIDRSGDKGLFFLETLRNYIKENSFGKKIIIIAPIGNEYFEGSNKQSYLKTIDYRVNFKPSKIGYTKFISEVFSDHLVNEKNFIEHLDYLLRLIAREKSLTIREIKHVLRLTNLRFQKLSDVESSGINPKIFILFEILDYLGEHIYSVVNGNKKIKNDFWGMRFLLMIVMNLDEKTLGQSSYRTDLPFFLEGENYTPSLNTHAIHKEDEGYYLSSQYLDLFE